MFHILTNMFNYWLFKNKNQMARNFYPKHISLSFTLHSKEKSPFIDHLTSDSYQSYSIYAIEIEF